MDRQIELVGLTGTAYAYTPMTIESAWNSVAGNYAFASQTELGNWRILYVAETPSLRDSLPQHPLWPEALKFGCTHVLAHLNDDGAQARQLEEHDLIVALEPPMNVMHHAMAPKA